MSDLVDRLLLPDPHGETYCSFSNADGKRWFVPKAHLRVGAEVYEPTSARGRLFKSALPLVGSILPLGRLAGISYERRSLAPGIAGLVRGVFPVCDNVSVFGGTPSSDQKPTIEVFSADGRILGYVKASDSPHVGDSFSREAGTLRRIAAVGVPGVSEALYEGNCGGFHVFAQTNVKRPGYTVPTEMGVAHWEFLSELADRTAVASEARLTDAYRTITELHDRVSLLGDARGAVLEQSLGHGLAFVGGLHTFSLYHGDFTPWNTALNPDGTLGVFDFEYAQDTYPPYLDALHFFVQSELFVRGRDAEGILRDFHTFEKGYGRHSHQDPRGALCFYLLSVIDLYLGRGTDLEGAERSRIDTRIEILRRLYE